jgi:deoxyribonuclease-4
MRYRGFHVSIAGGIFRAFDEMNDLSINTIQIFLKSSNRWQDKPYKKEDVDLFREKWRANPGTKIFAHSAYLINPAADDALNKGRSLNALIDELNRAEKLGVSWIVLHPGSHKGTGIDSGISRATELIDRAFEKCHSTAGILLETTAGQGNAIGSTFEGIARIRESSRNSERLGVCIDTCHVFAAGYDFTTPAGLEMMMSEFDKTIGLENLKLIHCNDSKCDVGSNKDRHEHIGKGKIGEEGIRLILNNKYIKEIPIILETPKDGKNKQNSDKENLETILRLI